MLDDTDLSIAEVAFASGFGSLRQFNRAMREVFRAAPSDLRARRRRADRLVADGGLPLRMPFSPGYDWTAMLAHLRADAVPGVESVVDDTYRRTITLDGDPGMLEIGPAGQDHLLLRAHLPYWEGVIHVVERAARLVGIDQDADDRTPGAWAPLEIAVNAVADDVADLVRRHGTPVDGLGHGLTHAFPAAAVLADEPGIVGELARAVLADKIRLDWAEPRDDLLAALAAVGVPGPAANRIAWRLGVHRSKSLSSPYAIAAPSDS
ncbi:AlkA N-terminal domain-containing protein [Kutzneria kofuensis]|uniref:AlkA N-terminal domain-containing protein n=1 Tax=Kutzneria kofuensis TaxID=103725 RepID=UPI0031EE0CD1